jgi:predicted cupin superfamily sugar epimerase
MNAQQIIEFLGLEKHPEGGYYREVYRSSELIPKSALGKQHKADHSVSTAIYFLLTRDSFSALHRLSSDEIFHFYLGDPVILFEIEKNGRSRQTTLGDDLLHGQVPQHVVPAGAWQGLCLQPDSKFALLGTTVAPGFEFEDFELGDRGYLLQEFPEHGAWIERLTNP